MIKQRWSFKLMQALFVIAAYTGIRLATVYADPSLPIVSNQGIYAIEVYPLSHKLVLLLQGDEVKVYPIAVGNPVTPTPVGEYQVTYKGKNWGPSFGPRWIGLNVPWGYYGIHGTNKPDSIGKHKSHGCIRMRKRDVVELYDLVPVGTKVTIYGHVLGDLNQEPRSLTVNDIGADVQLIQSRLKSAGYFKGTCNGKFRSDTTAAVKRYQSDNGLVQSGIVTTRMYEKLGLFE